MEKIAADCAISPDSEILGLKKQDIGSKEEISTGPSNMLRGRLLGLISTLSLSGLVLATNQAEGAGPLQFPDIDQALPIGNIRQENVEPRRPIYDVISVHGIDNFAANGRRGGDELFVTVDGNTAKEQKFSELVFFDPDSQRECLESAFIGEEVNFSAYLWSRIPRPKTLLRFFDPTRIFSGVHYFKDDIDHRAKIIIPLAERIIEDLNSDKKVVLLGHSLGNSVITYAVNYLLLNNQELKQNIEENVFIMNTADPRSKVAYGVFWDNLVPSDMIEKVAEAVAGEVSITFWMDPLAQGADFGSTLNIDTVSAYKIMPSRPLQYISWIFPGIAHEAAFTDENACEVMKTAAFSFVNNQREVFEFASNDNIVNLEIEPQLSKAE